MQSVRVLIAESSQVAEGRRAAVELARRHGWTETDIGKVAIAATEAVTNLLKHGKKGELLVRYLEDAGVLEILALDKGPGMSSVAECFRDGYSTGGTAGTGLGAMVRQSSFLDIYSLRDQGSAVLLQFSPQVMSASAKIMEVGGWSVAMTGEEECGDAWAAHQHHGGCKILVVDGLGHGPLAADAARSAVRIFQNEFTLAPAMLLEAVHHGLRSTRGAAGAVTAIDTVQNTVTFAGIGNIVATLVAPTTNRHMVSMNGILGHGVRSFREFTYDWTDSSLLVMHSDGIGTRWDLGKYPGLAARSPSLIAGVLYRDFSRGHDDATILVTRQARIAA